MRIKMDAHMAGYVDAYIYRGIDAPLRVMGNRPPNARRCAPNPPRSAPSRPLVDGQRSGTFSGVITGAFLAEAASVVDNKLAVSGGVLSGFGVEADRQARLVLVVLTQSETDGPVRRVEVEIRPPTDDDPLVLEYELPDAAAGGEIGFAFFTIEVMLPVNGRWVFVVTGGTGTFSLPLEVSG
jgi:hypothetical protein